MKAYIVVVSHGHGELVSSLDCLSGLSENHTVIVKSNKADVALENYCNLNNITCLDNTYGLGFGSNNNFAVEYIRKNYDVSDDDYFVFLNPDVKIDSVAIDRLIFEVGNHGDLISTINLFLDDNKKRFDNSIREFPGMLDFVFSFLFRINKTIIDKGIYSERTIVPWAAGSFLCINSHLYSELDGFDEKYFMYCEDIDICFRASAIGRNVVFYPFIEAVHLAQHNNRNVFTKHFIWHLKSAFRFLKVRYTFSLKKLF